MNSKINIPLLILFWSDSPYNPYHFLQSNSHHCRRKKLSLLVHIILFLGSSDHPQNTRSFAPRHLDFCSSCGFPSFRRILRAHPCGKIDSQCPMANTSRRRCFYLDIHDILWLCRLSGFHPGHSCPTLCSQEAGIAPTECWGHRCNTRSCLLFDRGSCRSYGPHQCRIPTLHGCAGEAFGSSRAGMSCQLLFCPGSHGSRRL